MADEVLKIRVDVETAKVGELKSAIKQLNAEINVASREELPALIEQKKQLTEALNKLVPKSDSFTSTVKAARQEARVFRFALLEMVHGLDGVGSAMGVLTGAGESTKESIKIVTGSMQEALGAGLGLKFGMEALGGSFAAAAGPIGIAVGILTLFGSALAASNSANEKSQDTLDKATTKWIELEHAMKNVTDAEYLNNLQADITIAKQKELKIAAELHESSIGNFFDFLIGKDTQKEINSRLEVAKVGTSEATKIYLDAGKKVETEGSADFKRFKENEAHDTEVFAEVVKKDQDAQKAAYKRFLEDQQHDGEVYYDVLKKDQEEAAKNYKRFLEDQNHDEEIALELSKKTEEKRLNNFLKLAEPLAMGFNALGNEISYSLTKALGEAHSMFQIFVQAVLQGLVQIAAEIASSALISLIGTFLNFGTGGAFGSIFHTLTGFATGGTLNEPVFGIGASGRAYAFGENGPERFSPLTSSGGGGGGSTRIYGETRIDKGDIVISWKEGRTRDRMKGANY